MPGATPNKNYPYPLGGDPLTVAAHIQALATAVDAADAAQDVILGGAWNALTLLNGYTGTAKWKVVAKIGFVFGILSNGSGVAFNLPTAVRPLIARNALITGAPGPAQRMMSLNQVNGDATFDSALTAHGWGFQFMYEVA